MSRFTDLGGIVLPPFLPLSFLRRIEDLIDHIAGKMLDLPDIDHALFQR
jgi:3-polyprenyl-4-hydroxybenzoate decarboxylase